MTAFARVITIGKNSDMPKIVKIPVGVGVDGSAIRAPITIRGDEMLCPECKGWAEGCDRCEDRGIIEIEQDEETSAGRCLPAAEVGRPDARPSSGRPPSSGMMPDARATGDLSRHNSESGAHSVLRSVPSSSASHRPAEDMPPYALPGTFERVLDVVTTFAGIVVFSAIAWFFLVLA